MNVILNVAVIVLDYIQDVNVTNLDSIMIQMSLPVKPILVENAQFRVLELDRTVYAFKTSSFLLKQLGNALVKISIWHTIQPKAVEMVTDGHSVLLKSIAMHCSVWLDEMRLRFI